METTQKNWGAIAPPANYSDLREHYGDPGNDPHFEDNFIVTRAYTLANGQLVHVRSHVAVADRIGRIMAALHTTGHIKEIHTEDGCFNIRRVRGAAALSLHSWGLAIDINASEFPLGSSRHQAPELVEAFRREHFLCGDQFRHRRDPMHFEFCQALF